MQMEIVWRMFRLTAKRAVQFSDAEKGNFQLIRKKMKIDKKKGHRKDMLGNRRKEQCPEFGDIGTSTPENFG